MPWTELTMQSVSARSVQMWAASNRSIHSALVPTYQYRCEKCGDDFDVYQSFSDDSLTECPLVHGPEDSEPCGGLVKKVFGNIAVTFKGSGFYKTDSRSGSKTSSSSSNSDDSSDSKSDTKSDSSTSTSTTDKSSSSSKSSDKAASSSSSSGSSDSKKTPSSSSSSSSD